MMTSDSVRARCAVVAVGLTVAAWGAAGVVVHALPTTAPRTVDEALVLVCLLALLVALGWGWLQGLVAVTDAWRGSVGVRRPGTVRRLVLAACGVAAVAVLVAPAADATPHHPPRDVLAGLPLPERAVGPAPRPRDTAVVRSGDTLWALAAAELGPGATAVDIAHRWRSVYRRNRAVIGPDPDLIRPGQLLRLPHLTTREPT